MNRQKKKLTLNKETLRDLMAHNAGEVKGGDRSKKCNKPPTGGGATGCGPTCPTYTCTQVNTYCYCSVGCW